jgi:SAM-dependent methyltransferase
MNHQWPLGHWIADNQTTWEERVAIHLRDANGFYAVDRFRKGEDILMAIESAQIGNVADKHLLHLQCHVGLDTLCLARRGAIVTGLDFSTTAIAAAQALATEAGLDALFVKANVYDAMKVLKGGFDVVYLSWGSLNCLPDILRWSELAAALLAPGGFLQVEQHPFISVMKKRDGRLEPSYAWRTPMDRPILTEATATYTGDETRLANSRMHEWEHPLSDIITALLTSGLRLEFLRRARSIALAPSAHDGTGRRPHVLSSRQPGVDAIGILVESVEAEITLVRAAGPPPQGTQLRRLATGCGLQNPHACVAGDFSNGEAGIPRCPASFFTAVRAAVESGLVAQAGSTIFLVPQMSRHFVRDDPKR